MTKMIDVVLNLDSLHLPDGESVEDIINYLKQKYEMGYDPSYEILYEEAFDE